MRLLALETSGRSGSVAIAEHVPSGKRSETISDRPQASPLSSTVDGDGSIWIDAMELDPEWGSVKTLGPGVDQLLKRWGWSPSDLDGIAVVQGPGSFTGLRVGIATAKVMAYALEIPVVAIDTLDVIADQIALGVSESASELDCVAVVDAFRGESFWAKYRIVANRWTKVQETSITANEKLAAQLIAWESESKQGNGSETKPGALRRMVAGPSLNKLRLSFDGVLGERGFMADSGDWNWEAGSLGIPHATTVARLGLPRLMKGEVMDLFGLLPKYYRSSAAELKRDESKR